MSTLGRRNYDGYAEARLSGNVIYGHGDHSSGAALASISGNRIRRGDGGDDIAHVSNGYLYVGYDTPIGPIDSTGVKSSRGDVYVNGSATDVEKGAFWVALRYA
jgi:hypothetical protein